MNPILKIFILSLMICAGFNLPVHGVETGHLIGTVRTPAGKPVSYANVHLLDTNMGTSATRLGSFVVPRVPGGRYSIRVAASGYALIETTGVEIKPGVNTEIHFTIDMLRRLTRHCYCATVGSEELGSKVRTDVLGELARRRSRTPVR